VCVFSFSAKSSNQAVTFVAWPEREGRPRGARRGVLATWRRRNGKPSTDLVGARRPLPAAQARPPSAGGSPWTSWSPTGTSPCRASSPSLALAHHSSTARGVVRSLVNDASVSPQDECCHKSIFAIYASRPPGEHGSVVDQLTQRFRPLHHRAPHPGGGRRAAAAEKPRWQSSSTLFSPDRGARGGRRGGDFSSRMV
jgi:hypothetical protein